MRRICALRLVLIGACGRSSTTGSEVPAKLAAIDPPAGVGAASPSLVATRDGALVTWLEPADRKSHRLRFARFSDGRWNAATTIVEGENVVANWADVPSMTEQQDGVLIAHWAEKVPEPAAHAYAVILARSSDRGATWKRLGSPHRDGTATEHGFVSLVPDGSSTLVVWLDGRETVNDRGSTMLRAASVGETIGDEQVVDDRVCDCCSTAAAMTADGPAVVFRDRSDDELRDPWIARRLAGSWTQSRAVHQDRWMIAGCPVNGPAIASSGRELVVAWYTLADQRATVRVAFSSDSGGSFGRAIDVDVPRDLRAPIGRVDVVLDGTDAVVSWIAAEREVGHLLVRRVSRDGRLGPELELATIGAGRDGGFPRIENVGDELLASWTDTSSGRLRAGHIPRSAIK